jgi:hypothetical protein
LTSTLRDHIEKNHLKLYTTLAEEEGWRIRPRLVPQAGWQAAEEDGGEDL